MNSDHITHPYSNHHCKWNALLSTEKHMTPFRPRLSHHDHFITHRTSANVFTIYWINFNNTIWTLLRENSAGWRGRPWEMPLYANRRLRCSLLCVGVWDGTVWPGSVNVAWNVSVFPALFLQRALSSCTQALRVIVTHLVLKDWSEENETAWNVLSVLILEVQVETPETEWR